jgi:uncharacterized protein
MSRLPRRARELDKLLDKLPPESDAMLLSELDGLVAGLLVCPESIPSSEWTPCVVDAAELGAAALDDLPEGERLLDLLFQHYNATATDLRKGVYSPIFDVLERTGETVWQFWMDGFETAIALRPESWAKVEEASEETRSAFVMMMMLATLMHPDEPLPEGMTPLTDEEKDELTEEAPDLIADAVLVMSAWARSLDTGRAVPPDFETSRVEKVGRNEPCPCGSGKKYKKCCWPKEAEALAEFRARMTAA